ncbi:TetR/AcrR family transcriptional regulator [Terribacillus saccharophilus]|uniref:TetR/AcrR family transcriptional regulator n=1 Tax=Terribacillus saccharophilus TaxID=361277 RepID=UPI000C9C47A2|nr:MULTISPECIES: TetR/AcrR family transcriptional regulator [Terribacillus]MCM3225827.1 TetR/AcrR family transcriptional regulator [Terribacillus saccharophilus]MEC0281470.1 TetR/AcrR family transcriptional regulator [Terribacillus saccharophilus]MEC0291744.1 TetR/AcrR family transcriptional regulator [Terribacillus saccharophilus]
MEYEQNSTSKRRNRTKEHFREALIKLIKKKGYHAVTVKDIVEEAAYNRSTFYFHYQDKIELAEDLLDKMFAGLEGAAGIMYTPGRKTSTQEIDVPSFSLIAYIYEHKSFFELIKYEDTLPGMHTRFPNAIKNIYEEQFEFETINGMQVNMKYFKIYTGFGFYGLVRNLIAEDFKIPEEQFTKDVIELSQTHIQSFKYIGR